MKQSKNIFLLLFVGIFLISTTGVTVYKHYCNHGGMLYGVFMDVEHGCDTNDLPEVKSGYDCCNPSSDDEVKIDVDCCTCKVEVYQIDSDLATNDIHIEFAKNFDCDFVSDCPTYAFERPKFSISNKAPPVLTTLKRLSLYQMYLI